MNRKLFTLSSKAEDQGRTRYYGNFIALNEFGVSHELAALHDQKIRCSLSGNSVILIALGGFNQDYLKSCHKYIIRSNKWKQLPRLK